MTDSGLETTMNADEWEQEARGLGFMLLQIAGHYRQAKAALGGDSELLCSSILSAESYVKGPLHEKLALVDAGKAEDAEGETT